MRYIYSITNHISNSLRHQVLVSIPCPHPSIGCSYNPDRRNNNDGSGTLGFHYSYKYSFYPRRFRLGVPSLWPRLIIVSEGITSTAHMTRYDPLIRDGV
jgi:hypothetical protein